MTVKVHSGLCMKYSRWDIYIRILCTCTYVYVYCVYNTYKYNVGDTVH